MNTGDRLILLHEDDNVYVVVRPVESGDPLIVGGATIPAREGITVGHKVARRPLAAGERVIKYGAPIGSMTQDCAAGEWVHMHNMKSDYIAAHLRDAAGDAS
ncbi:UxaA family hydrolase [Sphingomonas morindae]|uniref:UxaA family hydrolase n=1 Tax=Sphingomonas morindae TaxID=1541170 RepID=A0ABY4XCX6_9SPHN|nr:UxaA family hydrolase [Sphingomonas morindae]USI74829.1 UxaA family hydrolase [Sphingomonas morindae]